MWREKKKGVSPIDIKRFKGRMFSNPLLVVFAKVPKFRETKYVLGEGNKRIEQNFIHEEKIIFSKFDENKQFEKGDVFKPIMGTLQSFSRIWFKTKNYCNRSVGQSKI